MYRLRFFSFYYLYRKLYTHAHAPVLPPRFVHSAVLSQYIIIPYLTSPTQPVSTPFLFSAALCPQISDPRRSLTSPLLDRIACLLALLSFWFSVFVFFAEVKTRTRFPHAVGGTVYTLVIIISLVTPSLLPRILSPRVLTLSEKRRPLTCVSSPLPRSPSLTQPSSAQSHSSAHHRIHITRRRRRSCSQLVLSHTCSISSPFPPYRLVSATSFSVYCLPVVLFVVYV